jgi:hypothetical protein
MLVATVKRLWACIDRPPFIVAHDVKRVLANIDADDDDRGTQFLGYGVLLSFGAPGQHDLAGGAGARPDHPISGHRARVEICQLS